MVEVTMVATSNVQTGADRTQPIVSDDWRYTIAGRSGLVQITPTSAPHWYADCDLDDDQKEEVLAAIEAQLDGELTRRAAKN